MCYQVLLHNGTKYVAMKIALEGSWFWEIDQSRCMVGAERSFCAAAFGVFQ